MISAPETDILAFNVEDVARQIHHIRRGGEKPLRVRVSTREWMHMKASESAIRQHTWAVQPTLSQIRDGVCEPLTFCGLPLRIDRDWRGPITVETLRDQKPV